MLLSVALVSGAALVGNTELAVNARKVTLRIEERRQVNMFMCRFSFFSLSVILDFDPAARDQDGAFEESSLPIGGSRAGQVGGDGGRELLRLNQGASVKHAAVFDNAKALGIEIATGSASKIDVQRGVIGGVGRTGACATT